MDSTLADFPFVQAFLDDVILSDNVIISGTTEAECYENTLLVLQNFRSQNVKVKLKVYFFFKQGGIFRTSDWS